MPSWRFRCRLTSLICRFVFNAFDDQYLSTIGVKVSKKIIRFSETEHKNIEMQLFIWDIEGFNKEAALTEEYYTAPAAQLSWAI